jgi:hypothetical protein
MPFVVSYYYVRLIVTQEKKNVSDWKKQLAKALGLYPAGSVEHAGRIRFVILYETQDPAVRLGTLQKNECIPGADRTVCRILSGKLQRYPETQLF